MSLFTGFICRIKFGPVLFEIRLGVFGKESSVVLKLEEKWW